ncbi:hypothetical protein PHISP_02043 [Aspergillus sp. HF37]|nr:hypothetical protein PHISP_02043 [Aspergillus sp. HF37]
MLLRELHKCVLDHIVHFAHLRIEYVAMGYMAHGPVDNDVAHILYPTRLGLDICALERIVNANQVGTSGKKKSAVPLAFKGPASELCLEELTCDESNVFGKGGRIDKVIKGLKVSDIDGIKMWEKDTWNIRL